MVTTKARRMRWSKRSECGSFCGKGNQLWSCCSESATWTPKNEVSQDQVFLQLASCCITHAQWRQLFLKVAPMLTVAAKRSHSRCCRTQLNLFAYRSWKWIIYWVSWTYRQRRNQLQMKRRVVLQSSYCLRCTSVSCALRASLQLLSPSCVYYLYHPYVQFLLAVQDRQMKDALTMARELLVYEPDNKMIKEYHKYIQEYIAQGINKSNLVESAFGK